MCVCVCVCVCVYAGARASDIGYVCVFRFVKTHLQFTNSFISGYLSKQPFLFIYCKRTMHSPVSMWHRKHDVKLEKQNWMQAKTKTQQRNNSNKTLPSKEQEKNKKQKMHAGN